MANSRRDEFATVEKRKTRGKRNAVNSNLISCKLVYYHKHDSAKKTTKNHNTRQGCYLPCYKAPSTISSLYKYITSNIDL